MEGEMGVLSIQFENTVKNNDVDSSKKRNECPIITLENEKNNDVDSSKKRHDCPIITLALCPYKFYCPPPNAPSPRV